MGIGVSWWTFAVSVWVLVSISKSVLVVCKDYFVIPWVATIQENLTNNVPGWIKIGALYNYH